MRRRDLPQPREQAAGIGRHPDMPSGRCHAAVKVKMAARFAGLNRANAFTCSTMRIKAANADGRHCDVLASADDYPAYRKASLAPPTH